MVAQAKKSRPNRGWHPNDPRSIRVAENIEIVLNAAHDMFLAQGYDGTSMDSIAAKAGVSKMTVYRHFKDKETLFLAIIQRECGRLTDESVYHPAETLDEARDLLRHFAHSLMEYVGRPDMVSFAHILYGVVPRFPELGKLFYRCGPARGLQAVERILSKLVPHDQLSLRAQAFFYSVWGDAYQQLLCGTITFNSRALFSPQIEYAIVTVLHGIDATSAARTFPTRLVPRAKTAKKTVERTRQEPSKI